MKFTIPEDSTMTTIPGKSGTPPHVKAGPSTSRPPVTAGKLAASSGPQGSGGGNSSAGPSGTTSGPAGTRISSNYGSPPKTGASNADKSPRTPVPHTESGYRNVSSKTNFSK